MNETLILVTVLALGLVTAASGSAATIEVDATEKPPIAADHCPTEWGLAYYLACVVSEHVLDASIAIGSDHVPR